MANTFTAIIPTLITSANRIARELVGITPAVYKNADATRASLNQTISYPIVPTMSTASATPSNTSSTGTDITATNGTMSMSNLKKVSWHLTGEQERMFLTGDRPQDADYRSQVLTQAMRALVNEIELAVWQSAYKGASRAYGTAGTTPFATAADLSDIANIQRILDENGAEQNGRSLVVGPAAMANLRGKQSNLFKVNEAGTNELLRRGSIGELGGLSIGYSGQITSVAAGTGASYLVNNASNYAVGDSTIAADTGSGTILAGDFVTFTGDTNKYVVNTALSAGSLAIGAPGLKAALADNTAITVGAASTRNIAFQGNAIHLIMRAPETGNDSADDVVDVQDPVSGLVFQLARYGQYLQSSWELRVLYGVKVVNPEFVAVLLG